MNKFWGNASFQNWPKLKKGKIGINLNIFVSESLICIDIVKMSS